MVTAIIAPAAGFFYGASPIGSQLNLGDSSNPDFWQIVGVTGDVKHFGVDRAIQPEIYFSYLQAPGDWMNLIVRTPANPLSLVSAVRKEVLAIDKAQPVFDLQTLEQLVSQSIAPTRIT